jgi:N-acetylmuramoyl-L-alanine amidase
LRLRLVPLLLAAALLPRLACAEAAAADAKARPPAATPGLVGAGEAAKRLSAELLWDPLTGTGAFLRGSSELRFALGSSLLLWNGSEILKLDPPEDSGSGLSFTEASLSAIQKRFGEAEAASKSHFSVAAILIDPGHGGKDTGAVGEHVIGGKKLRVVEKDLTLDVSQRIYKALQARFPDKRILITRSGDSYPSLEERVEQANDVKLADNEAIIYISIHANASFNKTAKGFEVWYLNPEYRRTLVGKDATKKVGSDIAPILNAMLEEEFTTESIILARNIMDGLSTKIGAESPNRGVRAEEWFVVRNARMPSVLVETGFVTNPDEAKLLTSDDYLRRLSDGIYTGIVRFVDYFESMKGPAVP